jgi:hypothetical protein
MWRVAGTPSFAVSALCTGLFAAQFTAFVLRTVDWLPPPRAQMCVFCVTICCVNEFCEVIMKTRLFNDSYSRAQVQTSVWLTLHWRGYKLDSRGSILGRYWPSHQRLVLLGPPGFLCGGTAAGSKRPLREADHWPLLMLKLKFRWLTSPLPHTS